MNQLSILPANYCRCQRGAEWSVPPARIHPVPAAPPKSPTGVQGWVLLPTDAALVALPPTRVPRGGDSTGSQPVSPLEAGCWQGWVLREGDRAGPAARRGKGRRQLPWKQKIKSMHPAGGFGGKLGLARAGSLCPQGGCCSPQPRPSNTDPGSGCPALLHPQLWTCGLARTGTSCHQESIRPSVCPPSLSLCQCPERWPQLRWQRPH